MKVVVGLLILNIVTINVSTNLMLTWLLNIRYHSLFIGKNKHDSKLEEELRFHVVSSTC